MTQTDGLNILLAWVFFGILLATLGWLLLRSGQDDALTSVTRPAGSEGAVSADGGSRGDAPSTDGDLPGRPAA